MPRFFVEKSNIFSQDINITGEDVNHIKKVLRLNCGDEVTVCDGEGTDYDVEIESFEPGCIRARILSTARNTSEPGTSIILFQGIPKSDKMDFIIQKSVELGVNKIVPVMTDRTIVRIENTKDAQNKASRWQRISMEAAKQSNRGIIPKIDMPVTYDNAVKLLREMQLGIIPYENETRNSLKKCLSKSKYKQIGIMIGPEGGFTENEIVKAVTAGIQPVTLGPRILRTETAGIAVLSILMYELGDMGN